MSGLGRFTGGLGLGGAGNKVVPNSFIVEFKEGTAPAVIDTVAAELESNGGRVTSRFGAALLGFSAIIPQDRYSTVSAHPAIEKITPNYVVHLPRPVGNSAGAGIMGAGPHYEDM
ncbi:hypothetical protein H9P43_005331 [Blastocladiella emersonii ATCC 22665]|nr:hypothetical protein H9P43_005331 [Blastocladiella emersonii ATCC 22665]